MTRFAVIETDSGLTVAAIPAGASIEDVATRQGAYVVDPGPYESYEDAYDAMLALPDEEEEREAARE